MKKKSLGKTGSSWTVIFTIGLALFNLGVFGLILLFGNQMSKIIRQNFEIQVFMNQDFDLESVKEFQKKLASEPFVARNKNGLPSINYISKEEAGQRFMVETGEDFSQFLGENPLRDAFSIKVSERYLSPEKLKEIKTTLTAIPGVFEVVYVESLIDSIQENIQKITLIFSAIAFLLVFTAIWLIRNTIRLSIYSQRFLIRTMSLVGANNWFIQKPFVWNMLLQGFIGGLLSGICLLLGLHFVKDYYPPILMVLVPEEIGFLIVTLLISGGFLGGLTSWLSIRKYINKNLDQLHIY